MLKSKSVSYLLNILLFIPLGVIVPIVWKKMQKLTNVIGIGFFFTILIEMLMYGKEASNRKQEIDRQHYTIPNQRPKDKHCGKI